MSKRAYAAIGLGLVLLFGGMREYSHYLQENTNRKAAKLSEMSIEMFKTINSTKYAERIKELEEIAKKSKEEQEYHHNKRLFK